MKIFKHLSLLPLCVLFVLVIPHLHNQAYADPTIDEYSVTTSQSGPLGITTGPDGNLWFTENNGNKIGKITPSGSIQEWSIPTSSSGANSITTGPDGNLWFTESLVDKIGRITPSGSIQEWSIPTSSSNASNIITGPDGNLWFTENIQSIGVPSVIKVGRITTKGTIYEFPGPTNTVISDSGITSLTNGLDGNLWFTEGTSNQIGRFTTNGSITEYTIPTTDSFPVGITTGPDGNLWFTEQSGNKVGRITPSGTANDFSVPTSSSNPAIISPGPDGNLWFTEHGGNKIGRVNLPPRLPLVYIPGFMGSDFGVNQTFNPNITSCSQSTYNYNQGDTVWLDTSIPAIASYICGYYLDVLDLHSDGQTEVYSQVGPNGTVSKYDPTTSINATLSYLQQHGYKLGTNLFTFTYDWRKDVSLTTSQLDASISAILTQTGASKVQIIAHSMGGLVARNYISNSTRAEKVDSLVTLGTPHAGAPAALEALLYPTCLKWIIDINIGESKIQHLCVLRYDPTKR